MDKGKQIGYLTVTDSQKEIYNGMNFDQRGLVLELLSLCSIEKYKEVSKAITSILSSK